ncbi:MAG TPA: hypothetical protein VF485_15790 [Sphingomonas sp.]
MPAFMAESSWPQGESLAQQKLPVGLRPIVGHYALRLSVPKAVSGRRRALGPICFYRRTEVEMSNAELSDRQLLAEATAAFREKNFARAKHFLAELSKRTLAKSKAKVANDTA